MKAQKLNWKQARWTLYLSGFDFTLKYVAGKSMEQVDSLGRRVGYIEGVEKEAMKKIIEKIKKSEVKDDKIVKVVEEMKKAGVKILRNDEWQIEDKLVLKEEKVYVLKNKSLRLEIIWLHYNTLIVGYGR